MTTIDFYKKQIAQFPRLTAQDELTLAEQVQQGNEEARERFINANLRLVFFVAKKLQGKGMDFEDLIMEGNVGLIRAVEKFDPNMGFRFSTYAVRWIFQAIQRGLLNRGRLVRVPIHIFQEAIKVFKASEALRVSLKREPNNTEIAEQVGMDEDEVNDLLACYHGVLSLDGKVRDDSDMTFAELTPSNAPSPEEEVLINAEREQIAHAVSSLNEREAQIITLHYGLDGEAHTLEAIGDKMNVSRERVRQLKDTALVKLKEKLAA